jgi:hypothetical protein
VTGPCRGAPQLGLRRGVDGHRLAGNADQLGSIPADRQQRHPKLPHLGQRTAPSPKQWLRHWWNQVGQGTGRADRALQDKAIGSHFRGQFYGQAPAQSSVRDDTWSWGRRRNAQPEIQAPRPRTTTMSTGLSGSGCASAVASLTADLGTLSAVATFLPASRSPE